MADWMTDQGITFSDLTKMSDIKQAMKALEERTEAVTKLEKDDYLSSKIKAIGEKKKLEMAERIKELEKLIQDKESKD
jgi:exosome complex RNA-binding protein Rrp4